jgi:hypothetical protein
MEEFEIDEAKYHVETFGFDPTSIVRIVLENKELGLALVQIPLTILDNLISGKQELQWEGLPSTIGYYWQKNPSGLISIVAISEDVLSAIHEDGLTGYQYAGPLIPPK